MICIITANNRENQFVRSVVVMTDESCNLILLNTAEILFCPLATNGFRLLSVSRSGSANMTWEKDLSVSCLIAFYYCCRHLIAASLIIDKVWHGGFLCSVRGNDSLPLWNKAIPVCFVLFNWLVSWATKFINAQQKTHVTFPQKWM